ncbi:hypothetical protein HY993_03685, partial [Candidatus Micrarchaeota archaeon]|nr:hypothetical protein [Candidatus Micrarchaeota archaeon]
QQIAKGLANWQDQFNKSQAPAFCFISGVPDESHQKLFKGLSAGGGQGIKERVEKKTEIPLLSHLAGVRAFRAVVEKNPLTPATLATAEGVSHDEAKKFLAGKIENYASLSYENTGAGEGLALANYALVKTALGLSEVTKFTAVAALDWKSVDAAIIVKNELGIPFAYFACADYASKDSSEFLRREQNALSHADKIVLTHLNEFVRIAKSHKVGKLLGKKVGLDFLDHHDFALKQLELGQIKGIAENNFFPLSDRQKAAGILRNEGGLKKISLRKHTALIPFESAHFMARMI